MVAHSGDRRTNRQGEADRRAEARWALRDDRKLSPTAKLVWLILDARGLDPHPAIATLAGDCACSTRTVRRALNELIEYGWLRITCRTVRSGRTDTNLYELLGGPREGDTHDTLPLSPVSPSRVSPMSPKAVTKEVVTRSSNKTVDTGTGSARARANGLRELAEHAEPSGALPWPLKAQILNTWPGLAMSRTDLPGQRPGYPAASTSLPPAHPADPADTNWHDGPWTIGGLCTDPAELRARGLA